MNHEPQQPIRVNPAGKSPPRPAVGSRAVTTHLSEDDIFRDPFADFAPSGR